MQRSHISTFANVCQTEKIFVCYFFFRSFCVTRFSDLFTFQNAFQEKLKRISKFLSCRILNIDHTEKSTADYSINLDKIRNNSFFLFCHGFFFVNKETGFDCLWMNYNFFLVKYGFVCSVVFMEQKHVDRTRFINTIAIVVLMHLNELIMTSPFVCDLLSQ